MQPRTHKLNGGQSLLVREAVAEDARAVLDHVEVISGETDFVSFGPGEFELTESAEEEFLGKTHAADNRRAIRLYERKGFEKEGAISREFFLDGEFYDHAPTAAANCY